MMNHQNSPQGKMDCHGQTHIGRRRPTNEDQFLIADLNRSMRVFETSLGLDHQTRLFSNSQGKLILVADGMGGHEAGERASQLVVDSMVSYMLNAMPWIVAGNREGGAIREEFGAALRHCQQMLQHEVEAIPQRRGMGTTLTMAYLTWPHMFLVHVGDSRCYLSRRGQIRQLTRDHTLAALYEECVEKPPDSRQASNMLWNVICAEDGNLAPEVSSVELQLRDSLLLCTDGLYKHVPAERIAELLNSDDSSAAVCQQLIDEANAAGGTDNITAVVARFLDKKQPQDKAMAAEQPETASHRAAGETTEFVPADPT